MATTASVQLIDPKKLSPNRDNPRLIFRLQELDELEQSIASQGILVPLTVFEDRGKFILLDGERRWRCARKLGLHRVPAIVQPKPERVQNIMMMFAIHNARRDWDPLPTALKLRELEEELSKARGRKLTETELAASASLTRGAVRRYRKILKIPEDIQRALLKDLENPGDVRAISVDQVVEATDAASALVEQKIISAEQTKPFIDAVVDKFRNHIIKNTVEPRKIVSIARHVARGEVDSRRVTRSINKFQARADMTIADVVSETVENIEQQASLDRGLRNFEEKWLSKIETNTALADQFKERIEALIARLRALL
jgi:ParB/RepB/Spo0J family partition protein